MNSEEAIRDRTDESDVPLRSDVYEEIARELAKIGLNLAFFAFETGSHSSCSRELEGNTVSCPVLTLYLKYDSDFRQTGIDPHLGNWDDKWTQTRSVRDAVNAVLERHACDSDYVSNHTFVFVRTLEELAFRRIGEECIDALKNLVCAEAPGVNIDRVYWRAPEYYVLMRDKADYVRVKRNVKTKVTKALPGLFAKADEDGCCQVYKATIEFGYDGRVPMEFLRG